MEINKEVVNQFTNRPVKRGEIYYIGTKTEFSGAVQSYGRPFLVVSNNIGNINSGICICVPLTSKAKKPLPTHVCKTINGIRNTVLCEHFVTINKFDLCEQPIEYLSPEEMIDVDKALTISIAVERQSSISNKLMERYYSELERQLREKDFIYDKNNYLTKVKIVKIPVVEKSKINEMTDKDNHMDEIVALKQEIAKLTAERDIYKNMNDMLMNKVWAAI